MQPVLELQILSHWSGSEQATYEEVFKRKKVASFLVYTSFVNKTLAAIPGKTSKKRGKNFSREARIHPALAWLMFLADRVLWTIT